MITREREHRREVRGIGGEAIRERLAALAVQAEVEDDGRGLEAGPEDRLGLPCRARAADLGDARELQELAQRLERVRLVVDEQNALARPSSRLSSFARDEPALARARAGPGGQRGAYPLRRR